jgi:hypothetical protein
LDASFPELRTYDCKPIGRVTATEIRGTQENGATFSFLKSRCFSPGHFAGGRIHYGLEANRHRSVRPRCGARRYRRRRQTRSHISLPTYHRRLGERRNQETALLHLAYTLASLDCLAHELASSQKLRQLGDIRRDPPRLARSGTEVAKPHNHRSSSGINNRLAHGRKARGPVFAARV